MKWRRILYIFTTFFLLVIGSCIFIVTWVQKQAQPYQYSEVSQVPAHKVGLVFGAMVRSDGSLSPMLQDRVNGAIALYNAGKIEKILMSGDNGSTDYDEVTNMKKYALSYGIPEGDITLDYAGFNTYDSCYRARAIFQLKDVVLITQNYHLHRAIYTCRNLGIDAVGLALPDFSLYPDRKYPYTAREYAADLKAWWNLNFSHPKPKFLGKVEEIK